MSTQTINPRAIYTANRTTGSTLDQWYTTPTTSGTTVTGAPALDTLFANPFIISKTQTIDRMAVNITVLGSGSTPRLGIYTDDGNNYPGTLVVDAGTQDGGSTGIKTYTTGLPITLEAGLYWLVYFTNGTAPTFRTFSVSSLINVLGYSNTLTSTSGNAGWTKALSFDVLPSTFPAGGSIMNTNPVPAVFVRFNA